MGHKDAAIDRKCLHPTADVLYTPFRLLGGGGQVKTPVKAQLRIVVVRLGLLNVFRKQVGEFHKLVGHDLIDQFRWNGRIARRQDERLL